MRASELREVVDHFIDVFQGAVAESDGIKGKAYAEGYSAGYQACRGEVESPFVEEELPTFEEPDDLDNELDVIIQLVETLTMLKRIKNV